MGSLQFEDKLTYRPNMDEIENLPVLYRGLADWWPILSAPADYAEGHRAILARRFLNRLIGFFRIRQRFPLDECFFKI